MNKIIFPIFLQDKDGVVYMISKPNKVNEEIENIDVENKEYKLWDSNGLPLELILDQDKIIVKRDCHKPNIDQLRQAIFDYVKIFRPETSWESLRTERNMVRLFMAVEELLKKNNMFWRLKKVFFKK